ncbi:MULTISPECIES: hypothetical protein [Brevibacillus]|uniref:hypothetical protein n=1 Tax=Brevibacillus TaxID=55080 RepID=UPI000E391724|nr:MULTISPECIES: hypothetical protein [Brevibacillus]RED32930.1 hypothetical protein DES34_103246 [Brevibacillus brevis]TQK73855.1 hypothetical protein FB479_102493 [Brevibacillus sp. AG162]GEC91096.1 hypothetical protein BBR01nite_34270 [Brevibacillus brevis]VEF90600.1 Uncharacterised protein [Brevibacillus brevis]
MMFLTLVIFFAFLLIVWVVVRLLFRLEKHDSITHDERELWNRFQVKEQEIRYRKPKK